MTLSLRGPSPSTRAAISSRATTPGTNTTGAPASRNARPRRIASATSSPRSAPAAARTNGVGAGVEHEVDTGVPAGAQHRLDGGDRLVQRLHLVLEVAADGAGLDGPPGGLPGVAVAGLEVHRHRQVDRPGDPLDHVEVQLQRDVLAVLVAERRGDRVARGGQCADAVGRGDHLGGDDVPDVGQDEDLRGGVQVHQGLRARGEVRHAGQRSGHASRFPVLLSQDETRSDVRGGGDFSMPHPACRGAFP